MKEKLPATLINLVAWCDKILNDSTGREWRVNNFVHDFGIDDFVSFYSELIPFVSDLENEDFELFRNYVSLFVVNKSRLDEAKEDYWLADVVASMFSHTYFFGRSADDLIQVLKDIKTNTENIVYSLKISIKSD